MAESGKTLSQLIQSFPRYFMLKDKLPCPSELAFQAVTELRRRYSKETTSTVDGLKIIWPDSWIHLRPSNTEPIIRLIAESRSAARTRKILVSFKKELLEIMKKLS
jgi:Phosphomannomutase